MMKCPLPFSRGHTNALSVSRIWSLRTGFPFSPRTGESTRGQQLHVQLPPGAREGNCQAELWGLALGQAQVYFCHVTHMLYLLWQD